MSPPRPAPTSTRRETAALLLLVLATLGTRLPFIMHGLDEWDASNFALGVFHFDVLRHQPHPPGQYVYIRLLQWINAFTGNELFTLSLASAVGSSLALVPYYLTLRQIYRPAVALGASVLTAFAFGYWVTSLRMVSDPVATLFVYGVVGALLAGLTDERWFLFGMALCGVTLGVKQTALYFLAPLAVAVNLVVLRRRGLRYPLMGSIAFLVTVAAWLRPTLKNAHGWGEYIAACRSMQVENYDLESVIFHLSPASLWTQWQQNVLQPWGTVALAAVMLALALGGLVLCVRRGERGTLFALFGLTVTLYAFFFLYHFNKYYVYYVPVYAAFAAAALFAAGDFLARRWQRPWLGSVAPWVVIALITAANVARTAPLLPRIAHFRAPPQAALEALRKLPAAGLKPLLLTDQDAAAHELNYFRLKQRVDLLIVHKELWKAARALNLGRKIYLLTPVEFNLATTPLAAIRLVGRYVWPPELYDALQGRPDLRALSLYEFATPLPGAYAFDSVTSHPPLLLKGMWPDGWCGADSQFLLPCDDAGPNLVRLRLTAREAFGYHYPYRLVYRFADGPRLPLVIEHPGQTEFVAALPEKTGVRVVEMQMAAPQTVQPALREARSTDERELSVHLDALDCVSESVPMRLQRDGGWYDPERDGEHEARWTDGGAVLATLTNRPGVLVLRGDLLSITPGNAAEVLVDGRQVQTASLPDDGWSAFSWRVPLGAGAHRVVLRSRNPGVQPPGDTRKLALRVRDLKTRFEHL